MDVAMLMAATIGKMLLMLVTYALFGFGLLFVLFWIVVVMIYLTQRIGEWKNSE